MLGKERLPEDDAIKEFARQVGGFKQGGLYVGDWGNHRNLPPEVQALLPKLAIWKVEDGIVMAVPHPDDNHLSTVEPREGSRASNFKVLLERAKAAGVNIRICSVALEWYGGVFSKEVLEQFLRWRIENPE